MRWLVVSATLVAFVAPARGQDPTGNPESSKQPVVKRLTHHDELSVEVPKEANERQVADVLRSGNVVEISLKNGRPPISTIALLADKCRLRSLDLSECPIDESYAEALSKMTTLESLNLAGTNTNDALLAIVLPKLSRLTKLDLSRTKISNKSLPAIAKCSKLRDLSLAGCSLETALSTLLSQEPNLSSLAELKSLEILDLSQLHLHRRDFEHLQLLTTLRAIRCSPPSVSDLVELAAKNPNLLIGELLCKTEGIKYKCDSEGQLVAIGRIRVEQLTLIPARERRGLVEIELTLTRAVGLDALKESPELDSVTLALESLSESQIETLLQLPRLRVVRLYKCVVETRFLRRLDGKESIERIEILVGPRDAPVDGVSDIQKVRLVPQ
jgi:hypothetical protein